MRVSFGHTKTHFAFLLGLVPSFFFRRDVCKKGPPAQGRDRRQKKGVMEWGSIAPNQTSAAFV